MATSKKSVKIKLFEKQAKANLANALKAQKKLELELSKVKTDIAKMMTWEFGS